MSTGHSHRSPARDPITGQALYISELKSADGEITIRGHFDVPLFSRLNDEQTKFLETFLRCRGVISSVEKELGISYPTVRNRLDGLLSALDLAPAKEPTAAISADQSREVLDMLERGDITAEEAKIRIRGGKS
jgi:hypothetical protein